MLPNALRELRGMTQAITDSGLDWTIARITNPTNKPATRTIRAGLPRRGQRRLPYIAAGLGLVYLGEPEDGAAPRGGVRNADRRERR